MNDFLAANYTIFTLFAVLIVVHGVPHVIRLMRSKDKSKQTRTLAWLMVGVLLMVAGEGFVVGYFSGSRLWDRPEWMVWSDLPGIVRTLATIGLGIFYFTLYGRTPGAWLRDGCIAIVFVGFWYTVWHM